MSELGTGYLIAVDIESVNNTPMKDIDFSLSFYVYPRQAQVYGKEDLVRIDRKDGSRFFVLLDSRKVGRGRLMCRATIHDPQPHWPGGARPVVLTAYTGKCIGGDSRNYTPRPADDFDEGYRISFNFVTGLPAPDLAYIFYGHLVNRITDYASITPEMLVSPENHIVSVQAGEMGKTSCGLMEEGNKVVVLIPEETAYTATKDNGMGERMPFNTSILGSNGEQRVTIDGVTYRAYGEMMTTEGEMYIYVN